MYAAVEREIDKKDRIAGLEKGLKIIEAFSDLNQKLTPSTAARRTGINRTAARRHLLTLQHLGYLESDGQVFWLTPQILRLGWSYVDSARLPRTVQPFLERISESLSAEAYFSVLDGNELVYVGRSGFMREHQRQVMLGMRVSARLSAPGLLLMSQKSDPELHTWLEGEFPAVALTAHTFTGSAQVMDKIREVREQGFCVLDRQSDNDIRNLAVAVRDSRGRCVGAISVNVSLAYETAFEARQRILPALREAAVMLYSAL